MFNKNVCGKLQSKVLQPTPKTIPMTPSSIPQLSISIVQTPSLLSFLFETPPSIASSPSLNVSTLNLSLSTCPHCKIIITDVEQAFFDDTHKINERLIKLCADHQARLLPHQGLSAILDLNTFYNTMKFLALSLDVMSLKIPAINNYKAYAAHGLNIPKFKNTKPINLNKALKNYYEAIHCLDADIWHTAMEHETNSLCQQQVFVSADLSISHKAIKSLMGVCS